MMHLIIPLNIFDMLAGGSVGVTGGGVFYNQSYVVTRGMGQSLIEVMWYCDIYNAASPHVAMVIWYSIAHLCRGKSTTFEWVWPGKWAGQSVASFAVFAFNCTKIMQRVEYKLEKLDQVTKPSKSRICCS